MGASFKLMFRGMAGVLSGIPSARPPRQPRPIGSFRTDRIRLRRYWSAVKKDLDKSLEK